MKRERVQGKEAAGIITLIIILLIAESVAFFLSPYKKEIADSEPNRVINRDIDSIKLRESKPVDRKIYKKGGGLNVKQVNKLRELKELKERDEPFLFDPNYVTKDELVKLGMTHSQASVLISYRERGGKFRRAEDLKKIYSVTEEFYNKVINYIEISESYEETKLLPKIEINCADSAELIKLPGIGPYYASRIISYRKRLGGFINPIQLMEIPGVDSSRFALFANRVWADTTLIKKKDLNTVTYDELSKDPYIGSYKARHILRFRDNAKGAAINLVTLVVNNILKKDLLEILRFYYE